MGKHFKILLFIILIITVFQVTIDNVQASVKVEPSKFILSLEPGERKTGSIIVTNKTDQEKNIKALLYDWTLDKKENLVIEEKGTLKDSLEGLIKFNPRQFTLPPGLTQIVRFTVKRPEKIDYELRGVVFFEDEKAFSGESMGANVVTQVGATIYARPEKIDLSNFKFLGFRLYLPEKGSPRGLIIVENNCPVHLRYTIKYTLINSKGKQLLEEKVEEKYILPEFRKGEIIPFKTELKSGKYNLFLETSFEGIENKIKTTVPINIE